MKFYTLGYAETYERLLRKGRVWKAPGGWALSLDKAIQYRDQLLDNDLFANKFGLHKGTYNIYRLPECTPDIVNDEKLKEKTIIGRRITP